MPSSDMYGEKKKNKGVPALLIAGALAVALYSCGGNDETSSSNSRPTASASPSPTATRKPSPKPTEKPNLTPEGKEWHQVGDGKWGSEVPIHYGDKGPAVRKMVEDLEEIGCDMDMKHPDEANKRNMNGGVDYQEPIGTNPGGLTYKKTEMGPKTRKEYDKYIKDGGKAKCGWDIRMGHVDIPPVIVGDPEPPKVQKTTKPQPQEDCIPIPNLDPLDWISLPQTAATEDCRPITKH